MSPRPVKVKKVISNSKNTRREKRDIDKNKGEKTINYKKGRYKLKVWINNRFFGFGARSSSSPKQHGAQHTQHDR